MANYNTSRVCAEGGLASYTLPQLYLVHLGTVGCLTYCLVTCLAVWVVTVLHVCSHFVTAEITEAQLTVGSAYYTSQQADITATLQVRTF